MKLGKVALGEIGKHLNKADLTYSLIGNAASLALGGDHHEGVGDTVEVAMLHNVEEVYHNLSTQSPGVFHIAKTDKGTPALHYKNDIKIEAVDPRTSPDHAHLVDFNQGNNSKVQVVNNVPVRVLHEGLLLKDQLVKIGKHGGPSHSEFPLLMKDVSHLARLGLNKHTVEIGGSQLAEEGLKFALKHAGTEKKILEAVVDVGVLAL